MQVLHRLQKTQNPAPCALALGAFDGLHRGHRAVIAAAVDLARREGLAPGVFTFGDSPSGAPALLTQRDKLSLLEEWGVERVITPRFEDVKNVEAEEFFQGVLLGQCGARALFCGEDFRFGRGARGDVEALGAWCAAAGMSLTVVPPVTEGGEKISSTRIRGLVEVGDIPAANALLGRPFGYTLEVIHGNHIGTGLGTPTINQALPENFLLPPFGVYASVVRLEGRAYPGVTNIGVKPTVGSDRVLSETWILGYQGDLYGREVRLALLRFIRPEKKFASLAELKAEIERNARQAQEIVEKEFSPADPGKILYKPENLC